MAMKQHADVAQQVDPRKPVAYFEITKVVRHSEPVFHDGSGGSMGQALDHFLELSGRNGDEVQSVTLEFQPGEWREYASQWPLASGKA